MSRLSQFFGGDRSIPVEVFAVGGGGGGGGGGNPGNVYGGGNAGQVVYTNIYAITGKSYTVTIGVGGSAGIGSDSQSTTGFNGGNTIIGPVFASGGLGGFNGYSFYNSQFNTTTLISNGGIGASQPGIGITGGSGIPGSTIGLGSSVFGGGGGGSNGLGGSGGGGAGGIPAGTSGNPSTPGIPGSSNTGGGGGVGANQYSYTVPSPRPGLPNVVVVPATPGGDGGSGVVIIRYPSSYDAATVTGNSPTPAQSGYYVYRWNSPGTIIFN